MTFKEMPVVSVVTSVVCLVLSLSVSAFAQGSGVRGDFTGDGSSDLVLLHNNEDGAEDTMEFSFFSADLDESLEQPIAQVAFGNQGSHDAAALGDYDGDGVWDLGLTKVYPRKKVVTWRYRTYDGTLSDEVEFGVPGSKLISGCDFDGDGRSDLAFVRGKQLRFKNFDDDTATVVVLRTARYRHLSCADIDGDGKDDLIAKERGTVKLTRGKQVREVRAWITDAYSGSGARILRKARFGRSAQDGLVAGDIDGDGAAEIGYYRRQQASTNFVFNGKDDLARFALEMPLVKKGVGLTDATIYDGVGAFAGLIFKDADGGYHRAFYAPAMVAAPFTTTNMEAASSAALVPYVAVRQTSATSGSTSPTVPSPGGSLAAACSGGIRGVAPGFLWKPDSDVNDARGGKPVALAQGGYKLGGSVWNILAANGQKIGSLGYKPSSIPGINGGAAHYFSGCCGGSSDTGGGFATKARAAAGSITVYVQSGSRCLGPINNPNGRQGAIN